MTITPEELEAIKRRHQGAEGMYAFSHREAHQAHADRATLLSALRQRDAELVRMREALKEIARCERYLSEADTSYEYEMRQIELCRFIKTRAALGEQT